MPAGARLLQRLREDWGDDLTQDLVVWASEEQAVNRAELRELADLDVVRFSARLEERFATVRERIAAFEARLDTSVSDLRAEAATLMREQMKWMYLTWVGTVFPVAGLLVALAKDWL
jgi:hypothetical protein